MNRKAEKLGTARREMAVAEAAKALCPLWDAFEADYPGVAPNMERFARWFETKPARVIPLLQAAGLLPNVVVWMFGDMEGAIRVSDEEAYPALLSREMPEAGPFKIAHMWLPARYEALEACATTKTYPALLADARKFLAKAERMYFGPAGAPVKA